MRIRIDTRESEIYAQCNQCVERNGSMNEIHIESVMLPLGDMIICNDVGEELVIIERKTLGDLASSIRDGRYREQGFRLNGCELHNHNIIYLVEGNLQSYNETKSRLERKSLISSFVSLTYFKGFSLHRTENASESAEWILNYACKLQRENGKSFYQTNLQDESSEQINTKTYVDVVTRVKKDNVTTNNIAPIMLSQIPGVSAAVATAVMTRYGTLKQLIDALISNPNAIDDITISTKTNKQRKISKTSCQNIYKFLICGENNEPPNITENLEINST